MTAKRDRILSSRKIHITKWVTSESYLNDFETIFGYEI